MKRFFLLFSFAALTFGVQSCSKDEPTTTATTTCTWGNSILEGKTFKYTKFVKVSDGTDFTTTARTNDVCLNNTYSVQTGGRYTLTLASGCTTGSGGTWSTGTSNGANTLTFDGTTYVISSFDCNSFTFAFTTNGTSVLATMTKQ